MKLSGLNLHLTRQKYVLLWVRCGTSLCTSKYRCSVSLSGESIYQDGKHKIDDDFGRGVLHCLLRHFFTLLFQSFWSYNQTGFWVMVATILFAIVYGIVYMWPQYENCSMSSIP